MEWLLELKAPRVRPDIARQLEGAHGLVGPSEIRPLQAIVRAVDPRLDVEVSGSPWTVEVVVRDQPAEEFGEVAVTRISTGASFTFEPRRSLPITPV